MATVLVRTAIIYVLFTIAIRLMGKRQVGELQISELITTFMLSELAINPIQDISIPIAYALVPLVFLFSMEVITSFLVTKLPKFRRAFMGAPSIIIRSGELDQKELGRLRISISELLSELRLKNVSKIEDVDYAILEQNGQLSVFLKGNMQSSIGIAHAIIQDGKINYSALKEAGKSPDWVSERLQERNLKLKEAFLMTCDESGNINIIKKEEK